MIDVCVVGSFMMDLVVRASRRPVSGETLIGTSFEMFLGGKGFNQAVAAARSGARTAIVGRIGDDDFGRSLRAALKREGIDAAAVASDPTTGTGVGLPLVEPNGDNSIVVVPRANHRITVDDIRAAALVIEASNVLLLQLELPLPVVVEAAKVARSAGTKVVLDPAPAVGNLASFAGLVDVVVPNENEAASLTGLHCDGDNMPHIAARLHELTGATGIVVTRGAEGVFVVADDAFQLLDAHSVECVDSVGAGDAFCGAMAARLAAGAGLAEAARYGNAAGSLAVTKAGAEPSMPTAEEIARLLVDVAQP